MSAKDKFKKGDRVRPERHTFLIMLGLLKRSDSGTVVGYGRRPHCIRVLVDGRKTPVTYDADFWKKTK